MSRSACLPSIPNPNRFFKKLQMNRDCPSPLPIRRRSTRKRFISTWPRTALSNPNFFCCPLPIIFLHLTGTLLLSPRKTGYASLRMHPVSLLPRFCTIRRILFIPSGLLPLPTGSRFRRMICMSLQSGRVRMKPRLKPPHFLLMFSRRIFYRKNNKPAYIKANDCVPLFSLCR